MSGPPAWLWWALIVSVTAIPVFLITAVVSKLIDRHDSPGPIPRPAGPAQTATEATDLERSSR